jgi:hypothetical protein
MFGFNLGGDAWPGYYGPTTGNKGSCYKEETWAYLKRCGPAALGWRCYGDRQSFGEAPERDVDALWGIGQVNPHITTVQPGTPEAASYPCWKAATASQDWGALPRRT